MSARQKPSAEEEVRHLQVHPSVVFKLGADLITDDVQALTELVKNAYDADSGTASIEVDTQIWTDRNIGSEVSVPLDGVPTLPNLVRGRIRVTDRGTGMSETDIEEGWLTVSASRKRAMKESGTLTAKGRTPLGDKGLGRLGTQRLGDILEIETRQADGLARAIQIDWSDFSQANSLNDVDLRLTTRPTTEKAGTSLTIRSLRDPDRWSGAEGNELERELAAMISPHPHRGFEATLRINGELRDLRRRHDEVRSAAQIRYGLQYDDGVLDLGGRMSTSFFRPDVRAPKGDLPDFERLVERDNGLRFRNWILETSSKQCEALGLVPGDDDYFIEVSRSVRLDRMDGVAWADGRLADPGSFAGEIDFVALRLDQTDIFNTNAEYRKFIDAINGVRIYRDGFGVRVDSDWIGLGSRWSSGTSFYSLRPENVVGFIDLTARANPQLEETTNREGFQDNAAFRNFKLLIEQWRRFTEECQALVRRSYVQYRKENKLARVAGVPMTSEALLERTEERYSKVAQSAQLARKLETSLNRTVGALESDSEEIFGTSKVQRDAVVSARASLEDAHTMTANLASLDAEYAFAVGELKAVTAQLEAVQEQLSGAWEAVSLGITAEALSHEVHQIADRLRVRSQSIAKHLRTAGIDDVEVHGYVEHVRSSAAALNRQLGHLDPSLRYMRERRKPMNVGEFVKGIANHYNDVWLSRNIKVTVDLVKDFAIDINEGKLTQVLDNLLLNSGYWIDAGRAGGNAGENGVTVRVDAPYLVVTDTGPGVDDSVADLVFEPFVTTKAGGRGRGLGLFVVRQLLDTEGATIELDEPDGATGRRNTFRIRFDRVRRRR